jgi:hypothetical protein
MDLEDTESYRVSSFSPSSEEEEWKYRSTYVGGGGGGGGWLRGEEEEVVVQKTSSSRSMRGGSMTVEARERRVKKSRGCFCRCAATFTLGFGYSDKRVMTGWLVG